MSRCDEEKEELAEIATFSRIRQYMKSARASEGLLLVGPRAQAKPFWRGRQRRGERAVFNNQRSDFVEMFVGVGASRVRDLFENAKRTRPVSYLR